MRVLLFGTYDARRHPRVGVIGAGLAAAGAEVTVNNAPLRLDTATRVAMLRQPWRLPVLVAALTRCWTQLVRRHRTVSAVDAVVVGYLGHFDVVLARVLFRRTTIVLDHLISASDTGRDRGEGGALKQVALRWVDALALRCADIVVVDTLEHAEMLPPKHRPKAVVVAVGAPQEWYDARRPSGSDTDGPLRVVFFGQYAPLQGAPTIAAALAQLPHELVVGTMIGTGQELDAARTAAADADIDWRGWVEPEELPAIVASYDICLGIFGAGPKALRVVPNKVFQGAAAGCAIVTSDTAPQRRLLGAAAAYAPPGDADALAATLRRLANDRARVAQLRQAAAELADRAFVPAAVVQDLWARMSKQVS